MPFGLGITELIILIIALIVLFKPDRVKDIARSFGSAIKEFNKSLKETEKQVKEVKKNIGE